jgi:hypothetical protein
MNFALLILGCISRLAIRSTCVRLDVLCWAYLISLVPETVASNPNTRNDGNRLVGELSVRTPFRVFRSTLQGY